MTMQSDTGADGSTGPGRRLDELVHGGHTVAMLMTMIDGAHSSRPLTCLEVDGDEARFLVSLHTDWVQALARGEATVHLTVADTGHNVYFAANGTATISRDEVLRRHLWSPAADAFFDGPDDPDLGVLVFAASDGEYWEGPGSKLGRSLAMLRGAMHHDGEAVGRSGPIV